MHLVISFIRYMAEMKKEMFTELKPFHHGLKAAMPEMVDKQLERLHEETVETLTGDDDEAEVEVDIPYGLDSSGGHSVWNDETLRHEEVWAILQNQ